MNGYSKDTSNLQKLRDLTEKLGNLADTGLDTNEQRHTDYGQ
jgi:hypothetical protein